MIMPFQWVRDISSSFDNPQLMVPSPPPFCPSSSSSRRRKLRGTTVHKESAVMIKRFRYGKEMCVCVCVVWEERRRMNYQHQQTCIHVVVEVVESSAFDVYSLSTHAKRTGRSPLRSNNKRTRPRYLTAVMSMRSCFERRPLCISLEDRTDLHTLLAPIAFYVVKRIVCLVREAGQTSQTKRQ